MFSLLSLEQRGDVTIVRPKSSVLDYCSSERLGEEFQFLIDNSSQPNLVLNLDNVVHFSARCLGKLMGLYKSTSRKGGRIKFCSAHGITDELFQIVGFDKLFEIYSTEDDAVESFYVTRRQCA